MQRVLSTKLTRSIYENSSLLMYVERVLSFNDGWSILTKQKNNEWQEIITVLKSSGGDHLNDRAQSASIQYAMYSLDFQSSLKEHEWSEIPSLNMHLNLTKNRVFATVVGVEAITGSNFATEFYLNAPQRYQADAIDVTVLLIPTSGTITHFIELSGQPSRAFNLPTEEFCQAEMAKFGPLTSKAPIVLASFSPIAPEKIAVEEVTSLKFNTPSIERTIEFAPEFYQASVGLISYFGEILRQKDPQTKAKVRIEQDGNRVRLHIESPGGDIEIIEKQLEQYALVVSRQAAPETLLANRAHIMQLETQLDITRIQVKQAQDLLQLAEGQYTQRINNLEKQLEFLQTQFAVQIMQTGQVINLATQQNDSHERLQTALLAHAQMLFQDLLQEAQGNQVLLDAINSLRQHLMAGIEAIETEDQIKEALATVKQIKPSFLPRILSELVGATYKAAASSAVGATVTWLATHTL